MPDFIENPRRAPRAPIPCDVRLALRDGGFFQAPATDYGPRGCQLESPAALEPGSRVFVELVNERVPGPYRLSGRVAWCSPAPPWRGGVAFDPGSLRTAAEFFARLAAAYPGVDARGSAPDRIAGDAPLAPTPPPAGEALLLPEEANVLRALGAGRSAGALREALGSRWETTVNPLFSLLGRGYVVEGEPDPDAARGWAARLER